MLVPVGREQLASIRHWFLPERPGPTIAQHIIATGNGRCLADRWPRPRAVVVCSGGNYTLAGDPDALSPEDVRREVLGFVDAPASFVALLRAAADEVHDWPRMIFTLEGPFDAAGRACVVRALGAEDAEALAGLGPETSWISNTWGGPQGLAASGMGRGAFCDDRLVSVACPFFVGEQHEDLGVVTEPGFRGLGLSPACAAAVCRDVRRRGRVPTWTTSPDNAASLAVAAKLGARLQRRDRLLVVGMAPPVPAVDRS
jgi:RimJ/RimL family protein N-acetyltransferase